MFRKFLFFTTLLILSNTLFGQKFTLSGYVKDSSSGETINNAVISVKNSKASAVTNSFGFFSLTITPGNWNLQVSASGFNQLEYPLSLNKDEQIIFALLPEAEAFKEINIRAKRNDNVKKIDISTQSISGKTIKKIPAFLGEADVIKSIQLLPGVTTVGEGASGFNVRGGAIDQNLVLMDDAPVFNSAHLFGFFSIFNPDAVKDVQLIKGGIPANYEAV